LNIGGEESTASLNLINQERYLPLDPHLFVLVVVVVVVVVVAGLAGVRRKG
ncbi:hypothetical protein THAOC_37149, partial [Thalassiosira oceanica]